MSLKKESLKFEILNIRMSKDDDDHKDMNKILYIKDNIFFFKFSIYIFKNYKSLYSDLFLKNFEGF